MLEFCFISKGIRNPPKISAFFLFFLISVAQEWGLIEWSLLFHFRHFGWKMEFNWSFGEFNWLSPATGSLFLSLNCCYFLVGILESKLCNRLHFYYENKGSISGSSSYALFNFDVDSLVSFGIDSKWDKNWGLVRSKNVQEFV